MAHAYLFEAELNGAGGGWTDLTSDTNIKAADFDYEYGIRGGGPLDRVASIGTMTWAMKNGTNTSGGVNGYYMPGHASCRSGWEIGIAVRLSVTHGGTTYYKFRGTLVDVVPDAGTSGRRAVLCLAYDWMSEALNAFVRDTAIQQSKRSDQLVTTLLTSVHRQPAATSIKTGDSTFSYALDNVRDEKTSVLRALADVIHSEVSYVYPKGDTTQGGTLVVEARSTRPTAANAATFTDSDMHAVSAVRRRRDIANRFTVTVHPRQVDAAATTVLYSLTATNTKPEILPGQTLPLTVYFKDATGRFVRVAGDSVVTPVASTDYVGNSQSDGLGSDLTTDLSLVFTSSSNAATMAFTNNGSSSVYLTTLQVRGKVVADRYELSVITEDTASQDSHGENDLNYDMPFEDRTDIAKYVGEWMSNLYGSPRTIISELVIRGNHDDASMTQALAREPGDKITVSETMSGVSTTKYVVNGVKGNIKPGGILTTRLVLAPADQQQAWILEDAVAGLLETSTYLGWV